MENLIKFIYITLCFFIAVATINVCRCKKDYIFLITGMFFTVLSDFSLLILFNEIAGVTTFCFVHITYIFRLRLEKNVLYIFSGAFLLLLTTSVLPFIVAISLVYAYLFSLNIVFTVAYFCKSQSVLSSRILILAGTILFALCDINVLLFNLHRFLPYPVENHFENVLLFVWIFYAPAQLMLALSGMKQRIV